MNMNTFIVRVPVYFITHPGLSTEIHIKKRWRPIIYSFGRRGKNGAAAIEPISFN